MSRASVLACLTAIAALSPPSPVSAQGPGPRPPEFTSAEVSADRKITFRVLAPKAEKVTLSGGDIPGLGRGAAMTKSDQGIWEATVGPVEPGAYRYNFNVDGLAVIDPKNPSTSESNNNTWSLVYVPGSDSSDTKDVPHGAVTEATYYSKSLQKFRRMHVYTPPGYENGKGKFPVFYLLHGASDSDASWSTVGRAGFILDNLIAAKKAKPMIVVMPAGHTGAPRGGAAGGRGFGQQMKAFTDDFVNDLKPLVEANYRVADGRASRAIAGLSMGGAQTLDVAFSHLGDYGYVGVFSSGVFGITGGPGGAAPNTQWEDAHKAALDDDALKSGLRLIWFGCGKDDFLVQTSKASVDMLKGHKFEVTCHDTDGGHAWTNWRDYLRDFAPLLFTDK